MTITYIYTRTSLSGNTQILQFYECTAAEADDKARSLGWTPPSWWQWWRWDDTPRKPHSAADENTTTGEANG